MKDLRFSETNNVCFCREKTIYFPPICNKCCDIIIEKEIADFHQIIKPLNLNTKHGVDQRVIFLLFLDRNNVLGRNCRPDSWIVYINKYMTLGVHTCIKIMRTYKKLNPENPNNFCKYFPDGIGENGRKMVCALKKLVESV
jgi:hypothetical protein